MVYGDQEIFKVTSMTSKDTKVVQRDRLHSQLTPLQAVIELQKMADATRSRLESIAAKAAGA